MSKQPLFDNWLFQPVSMRQIINKYAVVLPLISAYGYLNTYLYYSGVCERFQLSLELIVIDILMIIKTLGLVMFYFLLLSTLTVSSFCLSLFANRWPLISVFLRYAIIITGIFIWTPDLFEKNFGYFMGDVLWALLVTIVIFKLTSKNINYTDKKNALKSLTKNKANRNKLVFSIILERKILSGVRRPITILLFLFWLSALTLEVGTKPMLHTVKKSYLKNTKYVFVVKFGDTYIFKYYDKDHHVYLDKTLLLKTSEDRIVLSHE